MSDEGRNYGIKLVCSNGHAPVNVRAGNLRNDPFAFSATLKTDFKLIVRPGGQLILDDRPILETNLLTLKGKPLNPEVRGAFLERGRARHNLKCKRCRTHLQVNSDRAERFVYGLITSPDVVWREARNPHPPYKGYLTITLDFQVVTRVLA